MTSEILAIPELKSFPEKLLFQPTNKALITNYLQLLPSNGCLQYQPPLQLENSPLQLEIYPLQIHDTYALDLTLYYQNITVSTSQFRQLNPQGCLLANQIQSSLGQTIVLYSEPTGNPEEVAPLLMPVSMLSGNKLNYKNPLAEGQLFVAPFLSTITVKKNPPNKVTFSSG